MSINCEIIQDLLPLYEDGVCSESSRAAVEAHLKECATCRGQRESVQMLPERSIILEPEEVKAVDGLKKVRRRWIISLIAILLLIPVGMLSVNQIRGAGVALTNLDDILLAKRYVTALAEGDYEEAADMMDYSSLYREICDVQDIPVENFQENTERVQIGDQVWYLDRILADDVRNETDAMNIWTQLVMNSNWGIMVPETIMQEIMEREGIVQEDTANGYALSYNQIFRRLETPWGTYLVEESDYQSFVQDNRENVDYALHFSMIPEGMYLDIRGDIEAYAEEMVAANKEYYGEVWNMTEEAFRTQVREQYVEKLKTVFAQGLKISDIRFYNAYRLGGGMWTVDIQVNVSRGDQRQEMHIRPDTVGDGKIRTVGWSYTRNHPWQEELMDALSFRYEN